MNNDNSFGKKLREIRLERKLSQAELAEMADVHEKHISKIETGLYKPNFKTLNKILKALNLRLEDIENDIDTVSANANPFYLRVMQILNRADEKQLEFYYMLLKTAEIGTGIFKD